jgi:hypothetical protein
MTFCLCMHGFPPVRVVTRVHELPDDPADAFDPDIDLHGNDAATTTGHCIASNPEA